MLWADCWYIVTSANCVVQIAMAAANSSRVVSIGRLVIFGVCYVESCPEEGQLRRIAEFKLAVDVRGG